MYTNDGIDERVRSPSDTIRILSVCLTFGTDHERTGADHEGSCSSPCLDSTLKCQDYLCKAINQESSKVEGGDKQVPLAARARYHNDAPTSHSLAKAPTPARLPLRQTLPKLEARGKFHVVLLTNLALTLNNLTTCSPNSALHLSSSDEVDQPVSRNHSVVTECGHSTPDELEVHVRNLWIKAQNKHERTNILFYSIRTTAPISLSTSPCRRTTATSPRASPLLLALASQSRPRKSAR
ncbi:hypothetical protein CMEL01_01218 [Colletotrichum melonis]|uniref:Uncharacterized protein n=1 Tax=Colletotrichum melonis TaxID=1209925 RepID=A0AAI9XZ39_9PEZI|nr:hypothetical protein CMEL01_01218 [Colletotrichum melonis]